MKISFTQSALSRAIGASALMLCLGAAQAADPASGKMQSFGQLDTNHDGYIDAKEAGASQEVSAWLSTADKDGDGKLSPNEFAKALSSTRIDQK